MIIGLPKEIKDNESRVGLTPAGVKTLSDSRHTVLVEKSAGEGSGIHDDEYRAANGQIVTSADEVWKRADMVVFDTRGPEWQPRGLANPIADLVYTATGSSVHTVIVDGNVIVDARVLTTIDRDTLIRETDETTAAVFKRLGFDHVRPRWPVRS